jgi:hypothetical protein
MAQIESSSEPQRKVMLGIPYPCRAEESTMIDGSLSFGTDTQKVCVP